MYMLYRCVYVCIRDCIGLIQRWWGCRKCGSQCPLCFYCANLLLLITNILYKEWSKFQLRASRLQCYEYLYRKCVVSCATHRLAHNTMYNKSIALADVGCSRKHNKTKTTMLTLQLSLYVYYTLFCINVYPKDNKSYYILYGILIRVMLVHLKGILLAHYHIFYQR